MNETQSKTKNWQKVKLGDILKLKYGFALQEKYRKPGKELQCGGWENWVKALEYEVEVFGHGKVRSNMVAGIEPKDSTLEGIEYLASKGVVGLATVWNPNPGSALEGHRCPETAWYLDLYKKIAAIHRKYGFTYDHLYDCSGATGVISDIYRIEDKTFPIPEAQVA